VGILKEAILRLDRFKLPPDAWKAVTSFAGGNKAGAQGVLGKMVRADRERLAKTLYESDLGRNETWNSFQGLVDSFRG
jgi:hypothetical protein